MLYVLFIPAGVIAACYLLMLTPQPGRWMQENPNWSAPLVGVLLALCYLIPCLWSYLAKAEVIRW